MRVASKWDILALVQRKDDEWRDTLLVRFASLLTGELEKVKRYKNLNTRGR